MAVLELAPIDLARFVVAALVIEVTPGPNMGWLVSLTLVEGRRAGVAAVAGIATGLLTLGAVAAAGIGAASDWFAPLLVYGRWAGALLMVFLALQAWRAAETSPVRAAPARDPDGGPAASTVPRAFGQGLATNLANPKALVFFATFLPGFLPEGGQGAAPVLATLVVIYVALATGVHLALVSVAARLAGPLEAGVGAGTLRRVLALALLALGIWMGLEAWRASS